MHYIHHIKTKTISNEVPLSPQNTCKCTLDKYFAWHTTCITHQGMKINWRLNSTTRTRHVVALKFTDLLSNEQTQWALTTAPEGGKETIELTQWALTTAAEGVRRPWSVDSPSEHCGGVCVGVAEEGVLVEGGRRPGFRSPDVSPLPLPLHTSFFTFCNTKQLIPSSMASRLLQQCCLHVLLFNYDYTVDIFIYTYINLHDINYINW